MAAATDLAPVGVVGTGTMGADLAAYLASRGLEVTIWSRQSAEEARRRVARVLHRFCPEGEGEALARLQTTASASALSECRLVVESVVEEISAKRAVMAALHEVLANEALMASNTSVLGDRVFSALPAERRAYCAGLHFFNPLFRMELVEINLHQGTEAFVGEALAGFAEALGKRPVRVPNVYGGVVSRMVLLLMNEGAMLAARGLAPVDVDQSMRWGAHHPMGPLALADVVGLDVVLANLKALSELEDDPRFAPHPLILDLVAEGHLGRKTGRGFYTYEQA